MLAGVVGGNMANAAGEPAVVEFSPTILGRIEANGEVVYQYTGASVIDDLAEIDAYAAVWVIKTATDCFIRVGCDPAGDIDTDIGQWYNTGGTGQGDPGSRTGTGTTVFQLNQLPDTVNIYNAADNSVIGSPAFTNMTGGTSYTSDNQTTFFNPTQDAKYGRQVHADSIVTGGFDVDIMEGNFDIQFTFRKADISDYTITFTGRARTQATSEL